MSGIIQELLDAGVEQDGIDRLLAQWGGLPLYVPQTFCPDHAIARVAGPEVASALVRLYGGLRPVLPLGASLRRERLRRQVHDLKEAGLNHVEIARRLGLHVRQVQRLAAGCPARPERPRDTRQMDLPI